MVPHVAPAYAWRQEITWWSTRHRLSPQAVWSAAVSQGERAPREARLSANTSRCSPRTCYVALQPLSASPSASSRARQLLHRLLKPSDVSEADLRAGVGVVTVATGQGRCARRGPTTAGVRNQLGTTGSLLRRDRSPNRAHHCYFIGFDNHASLSGSRIRRCGLRPPHVYM